jgi:hypothetical protein
MNESAMESTDYANRQITSDNEDRKLGRPTIGVTAMNRKMTR